MSQALCSIKCKQVTAGYHPAPPTSTNNSVPANKQSIIQSRPPLLTEDLLGLSPDTLEESTLLCLLSLPRVLLLPLLVLGGFCLRLVGGGRGWCGGLRGGGRVRGVGGKRGVGGGRRGVEGGRGRGVVRIVLVSNVYSTEDLVQRLV